MTSVLFKQESYRIVEACMEVHNQLGPGFLEVVYKDALEFEFSKEKIPNTREKEYVVNYKSIILPHKFYADFVVFDKIILEIKASSAIHENYLAQAFNYLTVSGERLANVVNFGEVRLNYKRLVK